MRKLWNRLPRLLRSGFYILMSIALILAIYTFLGAPLLSLEAQFRRTAKAHMVGPGEILGNVALEADLGSYRQMLLAQTEEGIILYCYDHAQYDPPELVYREKTGDITMLCAPYPNGNREQQTTAYLPVVIFDEYPQAVRAELDVTLRINYRDKAFEKTYRMEADRENPGYFVFRMAAHNAQGIGLEGTALQRFAMISGYFSGTYEDLTIPGRVRLYDERGALLLEKDVSTRSIPALTREQQEAG